MGLPNVGGLETDYLLNKRISEIIVQIPKVSPSPVETNCSLLFNPLRHPSDAQNGFRARFTQCFEFIVTVSPASSQTLGMRLTQVINQNLSTNTSQFISLKTDFIDRYVPFNSPISCELFSSALNPNFLAASHLIFTLGSR